MLFYLNDGRVLGVPSGTAVAFYLRADDPRTSTLAPAPRKRPTAPTPRKVKRAKATKPAKAPATKRPRAATADLDAARAKAYELFRSGKTLAEVCEALPHVKYSTLWNWSKHDKARAA